MHETHNLWISFNREPEINHSYYKACYSSEKSIAPKTGGLPLSHSAILSVAQCLSWGLRKTAIVLDLTHHSIYKG